MNLQKRTLVISALILFGAISFFVVSRIISDTPDAPATAETDKLSTTTEQFQPPETAQVTGDNLAPIPPGFKRYVRAQHLFTLSIPEHWSAAEYVEDEMGPGISTFVYEDPKTLEGFQIFLRPDATSGVGEDDIRADLPAGAQPQDITPVTIDGVSGIMFSHGEGEEALREIWLHHNGNLLEVTALLSYDTKLSALLETLRFTR